MKSSIYRIFILGLFLFVSACTGVLGPNNLTLAPEAALPDFVRDEPLPVQEAYRFAIANPEVLRQYPCYCGCGAMGHQHNLGCYIKSFEADGSIEFESHALG